MPMKGQKHKDKPSAMEQAEQKVNESPLEAQSRKDGAFVGVESMLPKRYSRTEMSWIDKGTGNFILLTP